MSPTSCWVDCLIIKLIPCLINLRIYWFDTLLYLQVWKCVLLIIYINENMGTNGFPELPCGISIWFLCPGILFEIILLFQICPWSPLEHVNLLAYHKHTTGCTPNTISHLNFCYVSFKHMDYPRKIWSSCLMFFDPNGIYKLLWTIPSHTDHYYLYTLILTKNLRRHKKKPLLIISIKVSIDNVIHQNIQTVQLCGQQHQSCTIPYNWRGVCDSVGILCLVTPCQ